MVRMCLLRLLSLLKRFEQRLHGYILGEDLGLKMGGGNLVSLFIFGVLVVSSAEVSGSGVLGIGRSCLLVT